MFGFNQVLTFWLKENDNVVWLDKHFYSIAIELNLM